MVATIILKCIFHFLNLWGKFMKFSARFAASLLAILPMTAQAQTTFTGADDGAPVGGVFTNSNAAFAAFFGAALPYSPLITNGFSTQPLGYSPSYTLMFATLTLAAPDFGPGYSGVSNTTFGNVYGFDVGTGTGNWLGFPTGSATLTLTGSTHAFGFYSTGVQDVFGTTFTVNYVSGGSHTFDVPINVNGGVNFFGVVDPTPFSSVTITRPGNDAWGIDNISYGFPAVPEPGTWAMMIGGFALAGMSMRRRKSRVSFA